MAYFILVPVFLVWLFLAGAVALVVRSRPAWRPAFPFVVHVGVWSSLGLIAAKIGLIIFVVVLARLIGHGGDPSTLQSVAQLAFGGLILLGPVFASALGWLLGVLLGFLVGYMKTRPLKASL